MKINLKDEKLYYIGGSVRDELLNIDCFDIDITYLGNAIKFAQSKNLDIIRINKPFGTVKVRINDQEIDIASTRNEIYPKKGHLPVVSEIGCSLKKDVERRDFTINTLAKSTLTGEITDYLGGIDDINNKLIRILHNDSFIDDPTRILRALKFSVRFIFDLEENTRERQESYLKNINYDMSYKRIKKEVIETFNLNSQLAYKKFFSENIYKLIYQENLEPVEYNIEELINKYPVKDIWLVYLCAIKNKQSKLSLPIPLTKRESKIIADFEDLKSFNSKDDYIIYNTFNNKEKESILLYAMTQNENIAKRYLDKLSQIKLQISGKDLKLLGIEPSKKFTECFEYITKEKLKKANLTKKEELSLAQDFFNK